MKTTVRHDITVRTIPADNDHELVVTTVTTDTATVEQTEVVKAKSRHSLVAHMGWTSRRDRSPRRGARHLRASVRGVRVARTNPTAARAAPLTGGRGLRR